MPAASLTSSFSDGGKNSPTKNDVPLTYRSNPISLSRSPSYTLRVINSLAGPSIDSIPCPYPSLPLKTKIFEKLVDIRVDSGPIWSVQRLGLGWAEGIQSIRIIDNYVSHQRLSCRGRLDAHIYI